LNPASKYKFIEAFDVCSMFIRVPEGRNEPYLSLVRVSSDPAEMKHGTAENERKLVFQTPVRANEWVSLFRNALLAAKTAEKTEETEFECGWKHKVCPYHVCASSLIFLCL
jgi:hypothetical protein